MGRVNGDAQLFCTQALLGAMIALRLTLLATAAFAAPAAEADADPQFLLGHGLAYAAPLVHHVVPVCKIVVETVVVGQRCHAEPDCTTEPVVVGRHITGHEEPTCTDVEHVVPHGVTKCVPKSVCVDVEAQVPKTVCGDAAAEAE